jgi:thioredoxin-related protein
MLPDMKRVMFLILCVPAMIHAQSDNGIKFVEGLNWNQIQAKAKTESKYIFIDCFATWCGPCKQMDKDIYQNEEVGNYVNGNFVSIKIQMDTTMQDNENVRMWYYQADNFRKNYKVSAYPTYLFFSPDGKIVHRDIGAKKINDFIELANAAIDTNRQYYTLVDNYQKGRKDYMGMVQLALTAQKFGDEKLANVIAKDYKRNYLEKLNDSALFTKKNIEFIGWFPSLLSSKDRMFNLFYNRASEVNKIMDLPGYADYYIRYVIKKEEIEAKLWHNKKPFTVKPDWSKISTTITHKYNAQYTESLIPEAEMTFYKTIGNWREYVLVFENIMKTKKLKGMSLHSFGDSWGLNLAAWDVFLYSADKWALSKALEWIELAIKLELKRENSAQYLDTKANLLYKMGKVKEAIACEEDAMAIGLENDRKVGINEGGYLFKEYRATVEKMKKGEPTWSVVEKGQ